VTSRADHLASLDIFRGVAVAGMILVNNPGNWSGTFEWLTHADWNGCTFADLVFPFFIFILFDVYDYQRWARPLSWLGFNPLAIYFLAELCGHLLDAPWSRGAAQQMTLRAWIFWDLLRLLAPDVRDEWLSLAFALVTVACWTTVAGALSRRRIRIQV
jgi:predicted acyltransferase